MEFAKEIIDKAKECKTAEEILALAEENEIELTKEDAEAFLDEFREGELADEELDNVVGGAEGCQRPNPHPLVYWENEGDVEFIYKPGDLVQAFAMWSSGHHTVTCKVVNTRVRHVVFSGYKDQYWLEKEPGHKAPFIKGYYDRNDIEQ